MGILLNSTLFSYGVGCPSYATFLLGDYGKLDMEQIPVVKCYIIKIKVKEMEENRQPNKKRRTTAAIIAVASIAIILFLCIFSLYHLPERDPVETPELAENATPVLTPAQDFAETNDIMSASQEQVSQMLGNLEMQYENAKLNSEPYAAQQAGMRLALAYWKAGQTQNAINLTDSLISDYSYDEAFVAKCKELLNTFNKEESNNNSQN